MQAEHRPIPAPEPDPEPNPAPDSVGQAAPCNISPTDWNDLFVAIQVRLAHCVDDALLHDPELSSQDRYALTKAVVLECVDAMKQLHTALTLERQQCQAHQQSQSHFQC